MSIPTLQLMLAVAVGSSALTFSLTWLYMQVRHLRERVRVLEAEHKPESPATRKRMPYEAAEEVLDAMAVLDAAEQKDLLQLEYVRNVKAHLAKALQTGTKRSGPIERDESEL